MVEEIIESHITNSDYLAAIMEALVLFHVLSLTSASELPPLLSESDPLYGKLRRVFLQTVHLDHPLVSEDSGRGIKERLENLSITIYQACVRLEPRPITFDAYPCNFLITPMGKAMLLDLEKLGQS